MIQLENIKLECSKAEGVILKFMITYFTDKTLDSIDKQILQFTFDRFITTLFNYGVSRKYWNETDLLQYNTHTKDGN